jgi:hypothetical protein
MTLPDPRRARGGGRGGTASRGQGAAERYMAS